MPRLVALIHEPHEGLDTIEPWANEHGLTIETVRLYEPHPNFPNPQRVDWLVIMGGSMNIDQHDRHPWLVDEKRWIRQVLENPNSRVLGVCLGAQLIASVLGSPVTKNPVQEQGWFPVTLTQEAQQHPLLRGVPATFMTFHWHEDTFELPSGAVRLGSSEACVNQGYVIDQRILGLQCHPETSAQGVRRFLSVCPDIETAGPFQQTAEQMLKDADRYEGELKAILYKMLDNLATNLVAS